MSNAGTLLSDDRSYIINFTIMEESNFSLNDTVLEDVLSVNATLKPVIDYALLIILLIIMFSMGCKITWTELKYHIKRPIGIGIGLTSQFIIMPLTAYTVMRSTGIDGLRATGILIISCCPGGVLSNFFALFCDGDLCLSVAMTTFSTLLAMGMMPFNLWVYGHSFETHDLVLPYGNLALSLIMITAPVAVGMATRWRFPKMALLLAKIFSGISSVLILVCIVAQVVIFPELFSGVSSKLYAVVLSLPLLGLTLGYVSAFAFRQNVPIRKTIAIECGVQNVPTAITIISLSFKPEYQEDIILLPWLYGFAMMTGCSVLCLLYQFYKHIMSKRAEKKSGFDLQME